MASIRWPLPQAQRGSDFETVGRYIGQTVIMERFIDLILLELGTAPHKLSRMRLGAKIEGVDSVIHRQGLALEGWSDLPRMMRKVAGHRNQFAHRMFERGALPSHYGQGLPYERLSDAELVEQEREAVIASEVCRQLVDRLTYGHSPTDGPAGRPGPDWAMAARVLLPDD